MHSIQLNHIRLDKPSLNEECKPDKRAFSLTSLHVALGGSHEAMTKGLLVGPLDGLAGGAPAGSGGHERQAAKSSPEEASVPSKGGRLTRHD